MQSVHASRRGRVPEPRRARREEVQEEHQEVPVRRARSRRGGGSGSRSLERPQRPDAGPGRRRRATTEADAPAIVAEPTAESAPKAPASKQPKPKGSTPTKKPAAAAKATKGGKAGKPSEAPSIARAGDERHRAGTAVRKRATKQRAAPEVASGAGGEPAPEVAAEAHSDAHATGTESATPVEADALAALADPAAVVAAAPKTRCAFQARARCPRCPRSSRSSRRSRCPQLVKRHVELLGRKPRIKNRVWLQRKLAWHEQTRRFGGLSGAAKKRLEELIAEVQLPVPTPRAKKATGTPFKSADELPIGTRLERIWHGRVIAATRVENGWRCEGKVHASLSAAAKAVTGGHISGPAFFRSPPAEGRLMPRTAKRKRAANGGRERRPHRASRCYCRVSRRGAPRPTSSARSTPSARRWTSYVALQDALPGLARARRSRYDDERLHRRQRRTAQRSSACSVSTREQG
jgi:hypothetical protein